MATTSSSIAIQFYPPDEGIKNVANLNVGKDLDWRRLAASTFSIRFHETYAITTSSEERALFALSVAIVRYIAGEILSLAPMEMLVEGANAPVFDKPAKSAAAMAKTAAKKTRAAKKEEGREMPQQPPSAVAAVKRDDIWGVLSKEKILVIQKYYAPYTYSDLKNIGMNSLAIGIEDLGETRGSALIKVCIAAATRVILRSDGSDIHTVLKEVYTSSQLE
jgi:hypothetical protein